MLVLVLGFIIPDMNVHTFSALSLSLSSENIGIPPLERLLYLSTNFQCLPSVAAAVMSLGGALLRTN